MKMDSRISVFISTRRGLFKETSNAFNAWMNKEMAANKIDEK